MVERQISSDSESERNSSSCISNASLNKRLSEYETPDENSFGKEIREINSTKYLQPTF